MRLFKPTANLPDHEKARVEFHLQQLSECLGAEVFRKPVVVPDVVFGHDPRNTSPQSILEIIGEHLEYDVSPVEIRTVPKALEMCGGGG